MKYYDVASRVALVAGGASGIGRAVVEQLSAGKAKCASLDVVAGHGSSGAHSELTGDVTSSIDLDRSVRAVVAELGSLEILVSAAGVFGVATHTAEVPTSSWERVMSVNATGTFYAIRAVVHQMARRAYGRITVASIAAKKGLTNGHAYAPPRPPSCRSPQRLGRDLAGTGVLANCVVPALIDTGMASTLSPEQCQFAISRILMGRLGRPEEVARLVAFLASEDVTFATGATFDVADGRANY